MCSGDTLSGPDKAHEWHKRPETGSLRGSTLLRGEIEAGIMWRKRSGEEACLARHQSRSLKTSNSSDRKQNVTPNVGRGWNYCELLNPLDSISVGVGIC